MKKCVLTLCLLSKMKAPFRTFEIADKIWQNPILEIRQTDGTQFKILNPQILIPMVGLKKYNKKLKDTLELGGEYIVISLGRESTSEPQSCFCGPFEILKSVLTSGYSPKTLYKIAKKNSGIQIEWEIKSQGLANFITSMSVAIVSEQTITRSSLLGFHDFDYFDKSIIPLIESIGRDLWVNVQIERNREDANGGDINFSFQPKYNLLTLSFD